MPQWKNKKDTVDAAYVFQQNKEKNLNFPILNNSRRHLSVDFCLFEVP